MKKIFLLFGIVLLLVALVGADFRKQKEAALILNNETEVKRKPCYGYTIIEYGKGINCNGDTVALSKVPGGGQQLAETTNDTRPG